MRTRLTAGALALLLLSGCAPRLALREVIEPDGRRSSWFKVEVPIIRGATSPEGAQASARVVELAREIPPILAELDPQVLADLIRLLSGLSGLSALQPPR